MIDLDVQKELQATEGPMRLHVKLQLQPGSFSTLYGPSGAGKTSTLKILAGLLKPDQGILKVNGKTWIDTGNGIHLPPQKRRIGFVFQDYALFPHMTVLDNLRFALPRHGDTAIVKRLLEMTALEGLRNRLPGELSGGQQQRVALARALVQQPELLLLDEPLAALDLATRIRLQDSLAELHHEFGLTTLLVSHDPGEIIKLSSRVYWMESGQITQDGKPGDLFISSRISGKFQFIGEVLQIEKQEVIFIVTVRVQAQVVRVIAGKEDVQSLRIGDSVLLASKAFNPILYKIS
jgi:molybdate transport system ATP-binding protein